MRTTEIPVYCWYCGKRFEIEIANVIAVHLFCSKECREDNLRMERCEEEIEKVMEGKKKGGEKSEEVNR